MAKATQLMDAYNRSVRDGSLDLEKFYKDQKITNQALKDSFESLKGGTGKVEDIKSALGGMTIKAKAAEIGMKALKAALDFGISMAISWVITKTVEGIEWLIKANERAIDSAKELAQQMNESMTSISNDLTTLNGLSSEYDILSKGVDQYGNNIALTSEEYARYKEIINQILNISPSLIQGYDAEGNALANNNNVLREAIELQKEKLKNEAYEASRITNLQTLQRGYAAQISESNKSISNTTRDYFGRMSDNARNGMANILSQYGIGNGFTNASLKLGGLALNTYDSLAASQSDVGSKNYIESKKAIQNNAKEIYAQMVSDTSNFTQDDIRSMQQYVEDITSLQNTAVSYKSDLLQSLQQVPQSLGILLNTNGASLYSDIVNSLSDATLTDGDIGQLRDGLIQLTQSLANDPELQKQVSQLFALDPSSMPAQDYQNQANALLQNLMSAFAAAGVQVDESKFRVLLGLDVATGVDLNSAKDKIAKTLGIAVKDLSDVSLPQIQALYKNLDELNGVSLEDAIAQIESLGDASELTFQKIIDASTSKFEAFNSAVDGIQSAYSSLSAAIDDVNQNGEISLDNLQQVLALDPQYFAMLNTENGQLSINDQLYQDLIDSKLTELKVTAIRNATTLINSFTNEGIAASYLAGQNRDLANSEMEVAYATLSASYATAQGKGGSIALASDEALNNLAKYLTLIDSASSGLMKHTDKSNSAADAANKLSDALQKQSQALQYQKSAMEDDRKNIESLLDKVMDMLKQRYDDEQAQIEATSNALQEKHDKEMDALEAEKDVMLDKVQAELDLLDAKEDEYKYEKDLADKNKSLALLQSQYAALEFDNSEATQKRKNELLDQIADKQTEIDEYQHDHSVDLQKDMLNKEKDNITESYQKKSDSLEASYEKQKAIYDKQIADIKAYTDKEVNIRAEAMALINSGSRALYDSLIVYNRNYGNMVDADITKLWNDAYNSIRKYQSGHYDVLTILNQIQNATVGLQGQIDALTPKINAAKAATDNLKASTLGVSGGVGNISSQYDNLINKMNKYNSAQKGVLDGLKAGAQIAIDAVNKTSKLVTGGEHSGLYLFGTNKAGKYASGTTYVPRTGMYNVDEQGEELIMNKPASGRYVTLSKGAGVMTAQDTKSLFGFLGDPKSYIRSQLKSMNLNTASNIVQNVGGSQMSYKGGDVYISGMVGDDVVKKFKQIQQNAVEEVFDKMADIESKKGTKPNIMNKLF